MRFVIALIAVLMVSPERLMGEPNLAEIATAFATTSSMVSNKKLAEIETLRLQIEFEALPEALNVRELPAAILQKAQHNGGCERLDQIGALTSVGAPLPHRDRFRCLALHSIRSIKPTAISNALIDYREMGVRDYPVIRFRAVLDAGLPILLRHLATTFHVERFS